jgi:hypothetical protein
MLGGSSSAQAEVYCSCIIELHGIVLRRWRWVQQLRAIQKKEHLLLSRLNAKPPERLVVVISIRFLGDVELGTVCSQNSRPRMGGAAFTLAELDLEKITSGVALLTSG